MRNFEKLGMNREQSERLTRDLTEILCINKDKIAAMFVSKSTLEKVYIDVSAFHCHHLKHSNAQQPADFLNCVVMNCQEAFLVIFM